MPTIQEQQIAGYLLLSRIAWRLSEVDNTARDFAYDLRSKLCDEMEMGDFFLAMELARLTNTERWIA